MPDEEFGKGIGRTLAEADKIFRPAKVEPLDVARLRAQEGANGIQLQTQEEREAELLAEERRLQLEKMLKPEHLS